VITDQSPAPIAVILVRTADLIEQKRYRVFQGGPNVWSALHRSSGDGTAALAAEHLRRFLGVSHVQFWAGDQAAAVRALRAAAVTAQVPKETAA
jgi:hypothetical protein